MHQQTHDVKPKQLHTPLVFAVPVTYHLSHIPDARHLTPGTHHLIPGTYNPSPGFVDTWRMGFLYFSSMRVLAIDLGSKRIGTAVSDGLGITVRPVETIRRSGRERDIARLKFLVEDLEAEAVVVGLPLRMDGTVGDAAEDAMRFVERLKERLGIPVFTQDERLTSYEAEQMMIERGLGREERRARSDEFAAMIILQDYLSTTKTKN